MNKTIAHSGQVRLVAILAVCGLICHGSAWASEHGGEAKAPPAEKNGEAKVTDDDAHYVRMRGIAATVFTDGRPVGALTVDIYLDLKNADNNVEVRAMEPRLRDRYLQKLGSVARNRVSLYRPLDLDLIGNALQTATNEVLGDGAAHVLISSAGVRRF